MKPDTSRRQFLKTSSAALAFALVSRRFDFNKAKLKLSFSTLGCPDWSFEKILEFAASNGYGGLELRGILRQMDLTKCPQFDTADHIAATMKQMQEKNLSFVDLGSSAEMHHSDPVERASNMDEAKRFIDLAQKIKCPYIRVFPNKLPKENKDATLDLIIKGLVEVGEYAKTTDVTVLMETHGEVTDSALIKKIMDAVNLPKVGLVWDVTNMWTITKEPPSQVYGLLKNYIHHTHIKDAQMIDGTPHYKFLGRGEVPIFEALDILHTSGYNGYYSFEWEKLWHPEIEDPELALADYPKVMKAHFHEDNP